MSWLDKLLGREKKEADDVAGDSSMPHEGMHQEQGGMATGQAEQAEGMAPPEPERPAEHHSDHPDG